MQAKMLQVGAGMPLISQCHEEAPASPSNIGLEDVGLPVVDDTPLIFPSQLRFEVFALERGLFVTSAISGEFLADPVASRLGDGIDAIDRGPWLRTGVKPDWKELRTLRARGVVELLTSSPGTLSGVKPWTGTPSQASKSSGAGRFLPIDDVEAIDSVTTTGVDRRSGVRALNTGGGTALRSGVLGRDNEEGPETVRFNGARENVADGGIGGMGGTAVEVSNRDHEAG